ncbi:hypothetical protein LCGC14_2363130 [marine sediment metagenome]|uniref:Uncharacterized protein n=1 Tax=marine sediment metagenome TaxID=412755 RepID=A0A0F9C5V6_9ZZZZ
MVAPIDFFNIPLLNKITEYLNLLTWEKWYLILLVVLLVLSLLITTFAQILSNSKQAQHKRVLRKIKEWALSFALVFLIILAFSPFILISLNWLGWIKGSIFILASFLLFGSLFLAIGNLAPSIGVKIKKSFVILGFGLSLIAIVVICLVLGEADYKYRKELKEKSKDKNLSIEVKKEIGQKI